RSSVVNTRPTAECHPLSLHDALPISAFRAREALSEPAFRRPAPARRACPRHGHRAEGAAARRAFRRARRQGAQGTAPLAACVPRSEEHTSELQSRENLVCRLLLEKKK